MPVCEIDGHVYTVGKRRLRYEDPQPLPLSFGSLDFSVASQNTFGKKKLNITYKVMLSQFVTSRHLWQKAPGRLRRPLRSFCLDREKDGGHFPAVLFHSFFTQL